MSLTKIKVNNQKIVNVDEMPTKNSNELVRSNGIVDMISIHDVSRWPSSWKHCGFNNTQAILTLEIASNVWMDSGWIKADNLKGVTFIQGNITNIYIVFASKDIDITASSVESGKWANIQNISSEDLTPLINTLKFEVGYIRILMYKNDISEEDILDSYLKIYYNSSNKTYESTLRLLYKKTNERKVDSSVSGYITSAGNITTHSAYFTRFYNVSEGEVIYLKGANHGTASLYCFALYKNGSASSANFVIGTSVGYAAGESNPSGAYVGELDDIIKIPNGVNFLALTSYISDGNDLIAYNVALKTSNDIIWTRYGYKDISSNGELELNTIDVSDRWLDSGWLPIETINGYEYSGSSDYKVHIILAHKDIDLTSDNLPNGYWISSQIDSYKKKDTNLYKYTETLDFNYIRFYIQKLSDGNITPDAIDAVNLKLINYNFGQLNSYYEYINSNILNINWQKVGFGFNANGFNLNISESTWRDSGWILIQDIYGAKFNKYVDLVNLYCLIASEDADITASSLSYDVCRFVQSLGDYIYWPTYNFVPKYLRILVNLSSDSTNNNGKFTGLLGLSLLRKNTLNISLSDYRQSNELTYMTITDGYLQSSGNIITNSQYKCRKYNIEGKRIVYISGYMKATPDVGIYGLYRASSDNSVSSANLMYVSLLRDVSDTQSWSGGRRERISLSIIVPKEAKYLVTNSYVDDFFLLAYDAVPVDTQRYIDCLGDSLTMGNTRLGWYEDEIQRLVGGAYKVRNFGVGGESIATIMARQGCASVCFPDSFVLPAASGSEVEVANGGQSKYMTSMFNGSDVVPLLQGSDTEYNQQIKVINPCYINGIELIMTRYLINQSGSSTTGSNIRYTLKRKYAGSRNITFPKNTSISFNTGKEMNKAEIVVIWMGTNGGYSTLQELVDAHIIMVRSLNTRKYIIVGLHKLSKTNGETYENLMYKEFGNKFFNIRLYCCSNLCYDAGITPTSTDITNMNNGVCPSCVLQDDTHFLPASNKAIGAYMHNMMKDLGYFD